MKSKILPILLGLFFAGLILTAFYQHNQKLQTLQQQINEQALTLTRHEALFANQTRPVIHIKYGQIYATEGEIIVEELNK